MWWAAAVQAAAEETINAAPDPLESFVNVAELIDYLQQIEPQTRVVHTEDDVQTPGEFLALDTIPLE